MKRSVLAVLSVLAMLLVACSGSGGESAGSDESATLASADAGVEERAAAPQPARAALSGGASGAANSSGTTSAENDASADSDTGGGDGSTGEAGSLPPLPPSDKIIKEGTVRLEVAKDTFDQAVVDITAAAAAVGGSVVAMSTTSKEGEAPSGSVTVRVPVAEYDALISDVDGIGTVRERSITSQDVTTEYVDLQARLRHAQAQERFYLGLLDRAVDVEDAIAVQQQVDGLQTEIERLRGRLRFIDNRTAFSTLTVELFEPGAPRVATKPPSSEPTLARYWETARAAFVTVVGSVLVTVVSLAPLLVLLLLGFLVWRAVRARPVSSAATPVE